MEWLKYKTFKSLTSSSIIIFLLLLIFSTFGEGSSLPEYSRDNDRQSTTTTVKSHIYNYHPHYHRCYVCLPSDKSSNIAKEIISTFPGQNVSDCSYFDSQTNVNLNPHTQFIFSCPMNYSGCLLRTQGSQVSRTCAHYPINDCKIANSIEFCYCTGSICNKDRTKFSTPPQAHLLAQESQYANNNGLFDEGETDDEDLLGPADGHGGSGHGPIDQSTSSSSSGSDSINHQNNGIDGSRKVDLDHNSNNNNNNKYIPSDHNRIDGNDHHQHRVNSIANFNSFSILLLLFQTILVFSFVEFNSSNSWIRVS